MNRAERIFRLHQHFKSSHPIALAELMDALAASRATLIRDIGYMRDFMAAPVVYDRDRNGYWYDRNSPNFELPGLWFNQSELHALLASEQLLEAVNPGLLGPSLGPLKARIRGLLAQSGHGSDTVGSRILVRTVAARPVDNESFGHVAAAVLDGTQLDFTYHGRERGTATRRRVHPYRLIHYRDNWFLIAWCEVRADLRTFSLDCIADIEPSAQPSRAPDETQLARHLNATFGIFAGEARAWAVLRFSPHRARWVADERWHADQIGQWTGTHYQLQVPYSDPRELIMDILKYGPEVEVLAPDELRRAVTERLREAAKMYESRDDTVVDRLTP